MRTRSCGWMCSTNAWAVLHGIAMAWAPALSRVCRWRKGPGLGELDAEQDVISGYDNQPIARYNIAPTTRVLILHSVDDGL